MDNRKNAMINHIDLEVENGIRKSGTNPIYISVSRGRSPLTGISHFKPNRLRNLHKGTDPRTRLTFCFQRTDFGKYQRNGII
jgi:hypothetical protein